MYSFRVFAARRDRTGAKDHPPHIQPPSPRTGMDGGPLGRAASAQTYPVSRSGWYWYLCRRDVGQGIPAASRAFRPTSSPPRLWWAQRGRGTSPRLPRWPRSACPDAAGRGPDLRDRLPLILQRGRLSRPCLRRSLSAAVFRGRHRIRHQSCKPDWVRRARTGRQPAAAPLRAASGGRSVIRHRDPHNSIGCHTGRGIVPDPEPQKRPPTTALCWNLSFWSSSQSGILHPLICDPPDTGPPGVFLPGVKSWTSNQVSSRCSCCSPFPRSSTISSCLGWKSGQLVLYPAQARQSGLSRWKVRRHWRGFMALHPAAGPPAQNPAPGCRGENIG